MHPISYAQNGEDIVLQRALSDINNGFYVDIGAFDPVSDSVTKAFYEDGWRGINIEPVPEFYHKFTTDRIRDENMNLAVGKQSGLFRMSVFNETGLSTLSDLLAHKHEKSGFEKKEIFVPMVTGNDIFERLDGQVVHFLKIDAEGSEGDIIESIDFQKHRPWIVLAEATEPNSQIRCDAEWAPVLTRNGYEFVYFDGLNAFFLAEEHADRRANLAKPPNVFDSFRTYKNQLMENKITEMQISIEKFEEIMKSQAETVENINIALVSTNSFNAKLKDDLLELENKSLLSKVYIEELEKKISLQSIEIANLRIFIDEIYP